MDADVDSIYIFDKCGRLTHRLLFPWSMVNYPYVKNAIISTHKNSTCGPCQQATELTDVPEDNTIQIESKNKTRKRRYINELSLEPDYNFISDGNGELMKRRLNRVVLEDVTDEFEPEQEFQIKDFKNTNFKPKKFRLTQQSHFQSSDNTNDTPFPLRVKLINPYQPKMNNNVVVQKHPKYFYPINFNSRKLIDKNNFVMHDKPKSYKLNSYEKKKNFELTLRDKEYNVGNSNRPSYEIKELKNLQTQITFDKKINDDEIFDEVNKNYEDHEVKKIRKKNLSI